MFKIVCCMLAVVHAVDCAGAVAYAQDIEGNKLLASSQRALHLYSHHLKRQSLNFEDVSHLCDDISKLSSKSFLMLLSSVTSYSKSPLTKEKLLAFSVLSASLHRNNHLKETIENHLVIERVEHSSEFVAVHYSSLDKDRQTWWASCINYSSDNFHRKVKLYIKQLNWDNADSFAEAAS